VTVVELATDDTRLPGFCCEKFILDDHGGINLRLLHLVLHSIAVDDLPSNALGQLHLIEFGATYGTAVGTLHPWLQTSVV